MTGGVIKERATGRVLAWLPAAARTALGIGATMTCTARHRDAHTKGRVDRKIS
jgi:hypothetical protein